MVSLRWGVSITTVAVAMLVAEACAPGGGRTRTASARTASAAAAGSAGAVTRAGQLATWTAGAVETLASADGAKTGTTLAPTAEAARQASDVARATEQWAQFEGKWASMATAFSMPYPSPGPTDVPPAPGAR